MLNNKVILITGGTGSFGKKCTELIINNYNPQKIVIFSRDELKQFEMSLLYKNHKNVRFLIGDIRDKERLYRAFANVDIIIHAAALKQVPACEYNPIEAIKTNINGAINVINAAIDQGVEKVLALSTDKAANPINLYGATKLCSDKLFVQGNAYVGDRKTKFSVVRYGNVVGSRGSVVPLFLSLRDKGVIPITDKRMTIFWITIAQGAKFVIDSLNRMTGGEIFVPKIPSMNIMDLAHAVAPDCKYEFIGIRAGEKIHEILVPEDDARRTLEFDDYYIIQPEHNFWSLDKASCKGKQCSIGFKYSSDNNDKWLSVEELQKMIPQIVLDK